MGKSDITLPPSVKDVTVRLARPDERRRWDATMAEQHYLGFQRFAGRGLRYVAEYERVWLALIGWQSGAFKCGPRDRWIGWRPREQFPRLRLIANNTRLLVLGPPGTLPNLATCVMAANLRRLSRDWQEAYGHPLELAEAFVDPKRFAGTLYAAGNWRSVGRTRGFSRSNGRYTEPHGHLKKMYLYPLRRGARKRLRARQPCLCWEPQRPHPVSPEAVPLPSLLQEFASIPDHRRPQGRKFQLPTLLAIWGLTRLSGYRGVDATWRYARSLNQQELRLLGAWRHPATGRYHPPSRATLHRALTDTDPEAFQGAVNRWVARRQPSKTALSTDGKRLRGANRQGEAHYETVSLVSHADAMPIASRVYTEEGGEVAAVLALLEDVDVRGSVITLDALHTTRNTALAIRRRHGAHYLFTVKGNAPETFQTLETIDWDRDATARFSEPDEKAHGRIDRRQIQVLKPLRGLINYPQVRQIFRVTRKRTQVKTDEESLEVAYGMTSLEPEQADAERLLALNRGHWVVENRNHRPRDTTFGEDACLMHTGHGPCNNAILNQTALAIIFHHGFTQVQAAVQHFAMDRDQALRALTESG
jgi:predicted transposase YbfD/YdcC